MSILRDEYTTTLADIHSHGEELVERYRDLMDQQVVSAPTESLLSHVVESRRALLERVEELESARGDLPKAGNSERALVRAIADWVQARVHSETTLIMRLIEAETEWRNLVDEAVDMDWSEYEQDVLSQLVVHCDHFIEELRLLQTSV